MSIDSKLAPVLALVRPKEAQVCHAHGLVFRRNHPVEIRDPALLGRIRRDGSLTVTLTEAGRAREVGTAQVEREVVPELAGPTKQVAKQVATQVATHVAAHVEGVAKVTTQVGLTEQPAAAMPAPAESKAPRTFRDACEFLGLDTPRVNAVLDACRESRTRQEIQHILGLANRQHLQHACLDPLLAAGLLERTIPDKPRSRNQRYRTTEAGLAVLADARFQG